MWNAYIDKGELKPFKSILIKKIIQATDFKDMVNS